LACQTSFAGGVPKETFPKLSGYQIGATPFVDGYLDPAYHKEMAKLDLVIIGSTKAIANETAAGIRRLNPNTILVKYTSLRSISTTFAGYMQLKRDKADAEKGPNQTNASDWWARDFDGNHVSHWKNNWTVNITSYVKPDANGDRFPEWAAKLDYDWWVKYDQWDGVYEDSVHWVPRTAHSGAAVDWSGGTESDSDKIRSDFRLGHQAYWNEMMRLAPGKYVLANHDWYRSEKPSVTDYQNLPEYDNKIHGGLIEIVMRSSDLEGSPRTNWSHAMTYLQRSEDYFLDPDLTTFVVSGEPDNYRFFRYSFATCLLSNAYFDYAPLGNIQYGTVEWFDEFDLAGTAGTDWLGRALDDPPTSAWKSGVWRRDFEGGVAIVNPQGNGGVTISVEQGLRRVSGAQDPQVNDGQPAEQITLLDGDGIILVRESAIKAPEVPIVPIAPIAPKPPVLQGD